MSKYTTELRFICEQLATNTESQGYDKTKEIIEKARVKIFNFEYPIFDDSYKSVLETKILKHFYFKEIGFETYGVWHMMLDTTMNEIMPYYNQLYESEKLTFNPFNDTDYTVDRNGKVDKQAHQKDDGTWTGSHDFKVDDTGNSTTDVTGKVTNETDSTDTVTTEGTVNGETHNTITRNETNNSNTDTTDTGTVDNSGHNDSTVTTDKLEWQYNHDTPQGSVSNLNDTKYLTSAQKNTADNSETTTGDNTNKETRNLKGSSKTNGGSEGTEENNGTSIDTTNQTVTDILHSTSTDNTTNNSETNVTNNRTDKGTEGGDSSNDMTRTDNTTEAWIEHIAGKRFGQSYSKLLKEFRDTFLNIDMMVINDLESLFMALW